MQPPICLLALLTFLILATVPSFSQVHGVHFHFKPLPAVLPRIRIYHLLLTSVSLCSNDSERALLCHPIHLPHHLAPRLPYFYKAVYIPEHFTLTDCVNECVLTLLMSHAGHKLHEPTTIFSV